MRVSRDEYWDAIRRATRGGATGRDAQRELRQFDPLDVLRWTAGVAALPQGDPFEFDRWQSEVASLVPDLVNADVDDYERVGHVPSYAPADTYETTEEQYWDGVRDLARYATRRVDAMDWPPTAKPYEKETALSEQLFELIGQHPFTADLPRVLDVLRHSQNLSPALADNVHWLEEKSEIDFNWQQTGKGTQFALEQLAQIALWEDAWRLLTSTGMYVPNGIPEAMRVRGFVQNALDQGIMSWSKELAPGLAMIIGHPGSPRLDVDDTSDVEVLLIELTDKGPEIVLRSRVSLFKALSSATKLEEEWSSGNRYRPNISAFSYWDHIKRIAPKVHYPPRYTEDIALMTFVSDYHDALDAMRMSSEPGMIGPYLVDTHVYHGRSAEEGTVIEGRLPGEPSDRDITVAELVLAAGRVAAVTDADHWGASRQPFASPAPPLMSLDDYLDYVRAAALIVARAPSPEAVFEKLLDPLQTAPAAPGRPHMAAHPLIAKARGDEFPYRALDVLYHTQHPEALWEDAKRRMAWTKMQHGTDWWKDGFNDACSGANSELAFSFLAASAFAADILDELGAIQLSKYAPNADVDELVARHGWSWELADHTLRSSGVARTHNGLLYVLTDDTGDIVPAEDEPALVGVYVEDRDAGEWVEVGQQVFPTLGTALERWAEVEVDPESGVG